MTLKEAIEYYQLNVCKSDSSKRSFDTILKNFPELVSKNLEDIKPTDVVTALNSRELNQRTRFRYYSFIKSACSRAINDHALDIKLNLDGLFKDDHRGKGIKYLLLEDVKKLMAYEVPKGKHRKQLALDLFLLMALSGMAVSDAYKFDPALHVTPDGKWFTYRRTKTDNECLIPITDDAREIINKYKGKWPLGRRIGSIRTFHNHCAWIGKIVGKDVSSHTARKTFGCLCLTWGFSLEATSHFLGHANSALTAKYYAQVTMSKIQNELDRIPKELMSLK